MNDPAYRPSDSELIRTIADAAALLPDCKAIIVSDAIYRRLSRAMWITNEQRDDRFFRLCIQGLTVMPESYLMPPSAFIVASAG